MMILKLEPSLSVTKLTQSGKVLYFHSIITSGFSKKLCLPPYRSTSDMTSLSQEQHVKMLLKDFKEEHFKAQDYYNLESG